jgi:hypothetical protein
MPNEMYINESDSSRRVVQPVLLVRVSDGTSAATNESGRTFYFSIGGVDYGSGGSVSAISAAMGLYSFNFSASKISRLGSGYAYYGLPNSSATALQTAVPFQVLPPPDYLESSLGASQLQAGSTTEIRLASGETTTDDWYNGWGVDVQYASGVWASNVISDYTGSNRSAKLKDTMAIITASGFTYRLRPSALDTDLSTVTIQGISNYANISNVTLAAGTHSDVTIQGVTRINSNVTLNANTHSGATIQGLSNYANISNVTLAAGTHSSVTIQGLSNYANISNVTLAAGTHSNVTIQGLTALSAAQMRSIASSVMSTNIGDGRLYQEAMFALRNRVLIEGSVGTVYQTDDTTSSWTFGITSLGTAPISGINPGGP